jgi:hypothetical protein
MRQWCPQGHHAYRWPHQHLGQVEQIVGIRSPAVQQHKALVTPIRATADQLVVGLAGLATHGGGSIAA